MTQQHQRLDLYVENAADFSECANEPIHIPGAIQPHGLLFSLNESDLRIKQVSTNVRDWLGLEPSRLIGSSFPTLLTPGDRDVLATAITTELETMDSLPLTLGGSHGPRSFGALFHRSPSSLVVELEPQPANLTDQNLHTSFRAMRAAANRLNAAITLDKLADVTARVIRELTNFDRVMIYRFDADANGEVIAEAAREGLSSFIGLHFPESDIPTQARALYLRSWLRLIPDASYEPSALVPQVDPTTRQPLDLSGSSLRSVSPIHCQYLANMGVKASMSVSLIHKGKLWGLIACHHYTGPLYVSATTRSAAEFLGQTASVLLGAKDETAAFDRALLVRSTQAQLLEQLQQKPELGVEALIDSQPNIADLVGASGVVVSINGQVHSVGKVPAAPDIDRLTNWLRDEGLANEAFSTSTLGLENADFADLAAVSSGLIAIAGPTSSEDFVLWFRQEVPMTVTWAGRPDDKVIDVTAPGGLGPRKSFEAWSQTLRGQAEPWTTHELLAAGEVAHRLFVQTMSELHGRIGTALREQAQFTLQELPRVPGMALAAEYQPGDGSLTGGDWYDAIPLPDGRVALVIGDVAGHGVVAASTMSQLRSAMRAYLVEDSAPATALRHLNELVSWLLPDALATGMVAVIDCSTGTVELSSAGHLPPLRITKGKPSLMELRRSPALGVSDAAHYETTTAAVSPGDMFVFYTDGLIERRGESWDRGLQRLLDCATDFDIDQLDNFASCMAQQGLGSTPNVDDVTILAMRLLPPD